RPARSPAPGTRAKAGPAGGRAPFKVNADPTPPAVTITAPASPTNALVVVFNVLFSEPVTGFTSSGVVVGGTAGATKAIVSGSGTSYTVAVSGMKDSGTVTLSLVASAASDLAGNASQSRATVTGTFNADLNSLVAV